MANIIGFEDIRVEAKAVGPSISALDGGVRCAVFYVDDQAPGRVRWRSGLTAQMTRGTSKGFPLRPGAWISVAGEGNIRNSLFERDGAIEGAVFVHALYFDQVDVIAADFAGATSNAVIEAKLDEILFELRRHTDALQEVVNRELVAS